jgi:hypothetical protein
MNSMRLFGYWTLLTALSVSAVAAYYSIIGLTAIFAAAVIPIIIMGISLEVAKITTAVWLHTYWHESNVFMRSYLIVATIILMIITSMGIFGFLSSAHIEQTSKATESIAQIERIDNAITRLQQDIARAEQVITTLQNQDTTNDAAIQVQIDTEQQRIETVRAQFTADVESITRRMEESLAMFETQITQADATLDTITNLISTNNIAQLQAIIGVKPDGSYGGQTAAAVAAYRDAQNVIKQQAVNEIQNVRARFNTDIDNQRVILNETVAQSNDLINRLRSSIGVTSTNDEVTTKINEANTRITALELSEAALITEKSALELVNRKLEAEVGPIKYIAALIYGDTNKQVLDSAVRIVIMMLVVVFDPLAIVLLLAGVVTLNKHGGVRDAHVTATPTPVILVDTDDTVTELPVVPEKQPAPAEQNYKVTSFAQQTNARPDTTKGHQHERTETPQDTTAEVLLQDTTDDSDDNTMDIQRSDSIVVSNTDNIHTRIKDLKAHFDDEKSAINHTLAVGPEATLLLQTPRGDDKPLVRKSANIDAGNLGRITEKK